MLRDARIGAYSLWDTTYAPSENGTADVVFRSVFPEENGDMIAVGGAMSEGDPDMRPFLVRIDRRGRVRYASADFETGEGKTLSGPAGSYEKIFSMPGADGEGPYLLAGTVSSAPGRPREIFLGRFSGTGGVSPLPPLREDGVDLVLADMAHALDGEGYVVAANAIRGPADNPEVSYGILMMLDGNGRELWRRSYQSGSPGRFEALAVYRGGYGDDAYFLAGTIRQDRPVQDALLIRVSPDGKIDWQRVYPRGAGAFLRAAAQVGTDLLVGGDVAPTDPQFTRSGWAMRLRATGGDVIWQRYLADPNYRMTGVAVSGETDGRATFLMRGQATEAAEEAFAQTHEERLRKALEQDLKEDTEAEAGDSALRSELIRSSMSGIVGKPFDHARVLMFSPYGDILSDSSYTEGQGAHALGMVLNTLGDRVLAGTYVPRNALSGDGAAGWILTLVPPDVYEDPCLEDPAEAN